ncbi:MAG: dephospho-CoA kinase [Helicobacteraceae bacterium]|jgi:dephospho-CoA kinase|nr:dephospho-CoA kinase [Helicobacteraceae bacterium]
MKNAIVLTGGVASGKSSAARFLKERGFNVIDADEIARALFVEFSKKIEAVFGTLDRAAIAKRIFSDKNERAKLEAILHPPIRARVFAESEKLEKLNKRYFIDVPLFFEKRDEYPIDDVLLIYAPRSTQLKRLIGERKIGELDALAMIDAQIPIDEKKKNAKWIIDNDGDLDRLRDQIDRFIETEIGIL